MRYVYITINMPPITSRLAAFAAITDFLRHAFARWRRRAAVFATATPIFYLLTRRRLLSAARFSTLFAGFRQDTATLLRHCHDDIARCRAIFSCTLLMPLILLRVTLS